MGWTEKQSPEGDAVFLDHVAWFVGDLEGAVAVFERLGFIVGQENVHMNRAADGSTAPSGTLNRLATTTIGFLEFLGARGDTPLARQHQAGLDRYEGLHLLAFSSADVPGEVPRLRDAGFRPDTPVDMRRKLEIDGETVEARFSVLRQPPEIMPEGRVQWCAHHTPEYVWEPSQPALPNHIDALTGALWIVDDVAEALDRYSRYLRKPPTAEGDGRGRIDLDRGALLFATPAAAAEMLPDLTAPTTPYGAAVYIRSSDLDATEAFMRAAEIDCRRDAGRLIVSRSEALGVMLVIHAPGDAP